MMKWIILLAGGALLWWWLEHMARGIGAGSNLPVAGALPTDAVYLQDETVAGVTVHVYSTPQGFYLVAPFAGTIRTLGPLSNLDITRLVQLQQALGGGS